jgi:arginyl-tRNA synthetase
MYPSPNNANKPKSPKYQSADPHHSHNNALVVSRIIEQGADYGLSKVGEGQRVLLECVSANPTGPLHVGHGRGAAYGASVANLLRAIGFVVYNEYYVNDAGRQMDILATSVYLREP